MLANRLKVLVAERGLMVKDVIENTGISRNVLSNMINNPFANVSNSNLDILCNYFDVKPNDFYDYLPWIFKFEYDCNVLSSVPSSINEFNKQKGTFGITVKSAGKSLTEPYLIHFKYNDISDDDRKESFVEMTGVPDFEVSFTPEEGKQIDQIYSEMSPFFKHWFQSAIKTNAILFLNDMLKHFGLKLKYHSSSVEVTFYSGTFENGDINSTLKELFSFTTSVKSDDSK